MSVIMTCRSAQFAPAFDGLRAMQRVGLPPLGDPSFPPCRTPRERHEAITRTLWEAWRREPPAAQPDTSESHISIYDFHSDDHGVMMTYARGGVISGLCMGPFAP